MESVIQAKPIYASRELYQSGSRYECEKGMERALSEDYLKNASVRMGVRVALGRIVPDGMSQGRRGSNHDQVKYQSSMRAEARFRRAGRWSAEGLRPPGAESAQK